MMVKCNDCIHKHLCPILEKVKALEKESDDFFKLRMQRVSGVGLEFKSEIARCPGYVRKVPKD